MRDISYYIPYTDIYAAFCARRTVRSGGMETPWFSHLSDREEIFLQGFRVCGLTMNTEGTAVGLARTEDKFVDRNTRHYWKTQISSPCALCSNSFYIGYRRFENFIKSCIMDIRRAIYATHWVRGLSHTKVPWAEVGQVGPQNFARFFAAERPLQTSPVMNRCGFGSFS